MDNYDGYDYRYDQIKATSAINNNSFQGDIIFNFNKPNDYVIDMSKSYFILRMEICKKLDGEKRPLGYTFDNLTYNYVLAKNAGLCCFSKCNYLVNNETVQSCYNPAIIDTSEKILFGNSNTNFNQKIIPVPLSKYVGDNDIAPQESQTLYNYDINGLIIYKKDGEYIKNNNGTFDYAKKSQFKFQLPFDIMKKNNLNFEKNQIILSVNSNFRQNMFDFNTNSVNNINSNFKNNYNGYNVEIPNIFSNDLDFNAAEEGDILVIVNDLTFYRCMYKTKNTIPKSILLKNTFIQFHTIVSNDDTFYLNSVKGMNAVTMLFISSKRSVNAQSSSSETSFDTGVAIAYSVVDQLQSIQLSYNGVQYPSFDYNMQLTTTFLESIDLNRAYSDLLINTQEKTILNINEWDKQKIFHWKIGNSGVQTEEKMQINVKSNVFTNFNLTTLCVISYYDSILEYDGNNVKSIKTIL